MPHLIEDCLRIIFTKLQYDRSSLYSCILVNRFWCQIAIPILWKDPEPFPYEDNSPPSHHKLYSTMIYFLPESSKQLLFDSNIILPSMAFSNKPLFNYISFVSKISAGFINQMINSLIKKDESQKNYK